MLSETCSRSDTANHEGHSPPCKNGSVAIPPDSSDAISLNSNDSVAPCTPPSWTRNTAFYFTLVSFRVGNQLFRVPRERFEKNSIVFRDMFAMNKDVPGPREGDSDDNPIYLEGINERAFQRFLLALYPLSCRASPAFLWRGGWIDVLHLSHMWKFREIREIAISELECYHFDEIRKVELVHKNDIEEWRMSSYIALAKRTLSLSVEDAEKLGLHFAIRMAQVRERRISRKDNADPEDELLRNDIEELLGVNNKRNGA